MGTPAGETLCLRSTGVCMLNGLSILIVEDEWLIALDLADTVEHLGGKVLGPVATVAQALALIKSSEARAAILDAHLLDRDVTPLAVQLLRSGVPFVIQTGTGISAELAQQYPHLPVVMKPVTSTAVVEALVSEIHLRT